MQSSGRFKSDMAAKIEGYKALSERFAQVNSSSQTLLKGFVDAEDDAVQVQLVWAKKDLVTNITHKFHTQYDVAGLETSKPRVRAGIFPSDWKIDAMAPSPSKKYVVTLTLEKGAEATEGVFAGIRFIIMGLSGLALTFIVTMTSVRGHKADHDVQGAQDCARYHLRGRAGRRTRVVA